MIFKGGKYNNKNNFLNINLKILKNIFFFISISYFIYYLLFNDLKISFEIDKHIYYFYLFSAMLLCGLSNFVNGIAWKNIILWFGQIEKIDNLVSFYILTNSLKYVPGGVWHFVERFNFLNNRVSRDLAFYVNIIEPYFMLSSSLLLASLGCYYNPFFLLLLLPSIFLHRNLIYFVIIKIESFKKKGIKILKKNSTKKQFYSRIKIKSSYPIKILFIEILFILFKYIGFLLCFYTFNNGDEFNYLFIFVVFCLSWSLGLIIPASPGGLGVFEGCFLFLMGNDYTQSTIITSLITFRFISSIVDLILSTPFLIKRFIKGNCR